MVPPISKNGQVKFLFQIDLLFWLIFAYCSFLFVCLLNTCFGGLCAYLYFLYLCASPAAYHFLGALTAQSEPQPAEAIN